MEIGNNDTLGGWGLIKFDTYPQLVNGNDAYVGVKTYQLVFGTKT